MVTTKLRVLDNGDLELPPRPRRRLRVTHRWGARRDPAPVAPTELGLSKLIA